MLHTRVIRVNMQETEGKTSRARALEIPLRPFSTFAPSRRKKENKREKKKREKEGRRENE